MIAALLALMLAQPPTPPETRIGAIRMHLFYEDSGRLSKDIAPPAEFTGWNTVIGEGSAEEAANDLLVLVEVRVPPGRALDQPLSIVARADGKLLGQRHFDNVLTTTMEGVSWKALWLADVGCAGRIEVSATIGRSTRRSEISLDCGE